MSLPNSSQDDEASDLHMPLFPNKVRLCNNCGKNYTRGQAFNKHAYSCSGKRKRDDSETTSSNPDIIKCVKTNESNSFAEVKSQELLYLNQGDSKELHIEDSLKEKTNEGPIFDFTEPTSLPSLTFINWLNRDGHIPIVKKLPVPILKFLSELSSPDLSVGKRGTIRVLKLIRDPDLNKSSLPGYKKLQRTVSKVFNDKNKDLIVRKTISLKVRCKRGKHVPFLTVEEHFDFCDITTLAVEMLLDPRNISSAQDGNYIWDSRYDGEILGELNTGNWWRIQSKSIPKRPFHHVLPIIIYIDDTVVDFVGNDKVKPIVMCVGNLKRAVWNKVSGMRLSGYFPRCPEPSNELVSYSHSQKCKRRFVQKVLRHLLTNINKYSQCGFSLFIDGHMRTFFPRLAYFCTDWPEGQSCLNLYTIANVMRCCRFCYMKRRSFLSLPIIRENIRYRTERVFLSKRKSIYRNKKLCLRKSTQWSTYFERVYIYILLRYICIKLFTLNF